MNNNKLVFSKKNYLLMLGGILVIIIGYILMSAETAPYGYGTLGLTIGPFVVVLGFAIEFFAIMYKPKSGDGSR
jgi:uncharacterized membrane protein HdeD (DUF308 family)